MKNILRSPWWHVRLVSSGQNLDRVAWVVMEKQWQAGWCREGHPLPLHRQQHHDLEPRRHFIRRAVSR